MTKNYYIGSGIGFAKNELNAFDAALLSTGVGNYNLVRISSILPTNSLKRDDVSVLQGSILYTAYSTLLCNEKNSVISSGVGIAIPYNQTSPGVIMEYSAHNKKQVVKDKLQEMLEIAMTDRGITDYSTDFSIVDTIVMDAFACTFACVSIW